MKMLILISLTTTITTSTTLTSTETITLSIGEIITTISMASTISKFYNEAGTTMADLQIGLGKGWLDGIGNQFFISKY